MKGRIRTARVAALLGLLLICETDASRAAPTNQASPRLLFSNDALAARSPALPLPRPNAGNAMGSITGSFIDGLLHDTMNSLQARVAELGQDLVGQLNETIGSAIKQLELTLGESIGKPITELSGTMRLVADRALGIATQLQASLASIASCTTQDAKLLVASLNVSLAANVRSVAFWKGASNFVAAGYVLGSDSRMGLYVHRPPASYKFVGVFDGLDPQCGAPEVTLKIGSQSVKADVISSDQQSIVATIPSLSSKGTYAVELGFKKRTGILHRCLANFEKVQTVIPVAEPPQFKCTYSAKAICNVAIVSSQIASMDFGNADCDGPVSRHVQLCPPPGSEYFNHVWEDLSRNGCDPANVQKVGGGCVNVDASCPERGGIFCTGPRKWLVGRLTLYSKSKTPTPAANPIKREATFGYGQTMKQVLFDPGSDQVPGGEHAAQCSWTVDAHVVWPNGRPTDIPSRTGTGQLTSSADNLKFDFNPNDGSMTVSTPPYICQYLN
jgi:hypothetical protein